MIQSGEMPTDCLQRVNITYTGFAWRHSLAAAWLDALATGHFERRSKYMHA